MAQSQHHLIRDVCQSVGRVIEERVAPLLAKEDGLDIECVFDCPEEDDSKKGKSASKSKKKLPVSILLVDTKRSESMQSTHEPVVREEDEDGNLIEYRCGPPTFMTLRLIVTPWGDANLENQAVLGAIMQHFVSFSQLPEECLVGEALNPEDNPFVELDDKIGVFEQMQLWESLGRKYRASLNYRIDVRLSSLRRVALRRVTEKVNQYRKLEG
ncbi:MAG: Pvc16 family protein [Planctomycetota bacterium]|jgi:hypothetical protein